MASSLNPVSGFSGPLRAMWINLWITCVQPVDNFRVVDNLCTAYAQLVENLWITWGGGGPMLAIIFTVAT